MACLLVIVGPLSRGQNFVYNNVVQDPKAHVALHTLGHHAASAHSYHRTRPMEPFKFRQGSYPAARPHFLLFCFLFSIVSWYHPNSIECQRLRALMATMDGDQKHTVELTNMAVGAE